MIQVKIKNERQVLKRFLTAPDKMAQALKKALASTGTFASGKVKDTIKEMRAIQTGALRRGISVQDKTDWSVTIKPSPATPYATYVHDGTGIYIGRKPYLAKIPGVGYRWMKGMKPRPFFTVTEDRSQKEIVDFFHEQLNKSMDEIFK